MHTNQRDEFISVLHNAAKSDKDILFLSVDFGAPALDAFREDFPEQFIHVGISEQNAIDLAAGLALSGKKVFVYGMAPFISMRCLEQIKMSLAQMNLPVVILSVGVGLGYADSGPTHYATEDLGAVRSIINLDVYSVSSVNQANSLAKYLLDKNLEGPSFVRLDRESLDEIYKDQALLDISLGFSTIYKSNASSKNLVITSGYASKISIEAKKNLGEDNFDWVDWFRIKPFPSEMSNLISNYEKVILIDEQTDYSESFGYLLSRLHAESPDLLKNCEFGRLNLGEKYFYDNGGRQFLHNSVGFSFNELKRLLQG